MAEPGTVVDAAADLLLGGRCAGCGRPGRVLCRDCASSLPDRAWPAWPSPVPPGLVSPWAAAAYDGLIRELVVGHKEHGLLGLRVPLGRLLALAVLEAVAREQVQDGPVALVPVPSRPGTARGRGHDPTLRLARTAARELRAVGLEAAARPLLRSRPGVVDQAGLGAQERAANLAGSMYAPSELLRRASVRGPLAGVVLCDDVITTGATLREAQRALESVGVRVLAAAAVAATQRRGDRSARTGDEGPLSSGASTA